MSKLTCKDLSVKYFGYDESIVGVSTNFYSGLNVVFAENKGGKTTFLKALAGVIPSTGSIFLDDEDVTTISPKDRDFQMVFDDYALFSRHTARYNLEYPLKIRKVPKAERRQRAEEAAALFDLDVMIDTPVYRLNEWHKMSLALCRAYLRAAKVLLIDNVFSRLDPLTRREAFRRYMPLFANRGIVIYATDDPAEAEAISDRIKLLSYGYLLQEGSAADLAKRPACLTAFLSFNDYASVLPCSLKEGGPALFDVLTQAPAELIGESYVGKEVIAGFLPTDFELSSKGFSAVVSAVFHKGEQKIYKLEREGEAFYALLQSAHAVGESLRIRPIRVSALFDPVNQRKIMRY